MSINITKATAADIITIQSIAASTWPTTYSDILSGNQISYMLDKMYKTTVLQTQIAAPNNQYFLAEKDGQVIGFCHVAASEDVATYKLHKIYVLPNIQKSGAGVSLLNAAEDYAKQNGAKDIILNVNRHNNAFQFYQKMGFQILRTEDIDIGNNYYMNDYVLTKSLS